MLVSIPHLYVHVPFCPTICPYCDFHVLERRAGMVEAYLRELARDAAQLRDAYRVELSTLYVGGGTPSFLRDREMEQLVGLVREHFGWANEEATLEVNPGTVTPERARLWRDLGFDRASVGVQSASDDTLRFLGRAHSARQGLQALDTLLEEGFRVSADVITAVPGQDVAADLRAVAERGVEHVSAYTLTIEEGTPFQRRGVSVREEDEERALELAESVLAGFGIERYEVSNHARPGAESRHNLAYWHNRYYLGLGPGAAGHYPAGGGDLLAVRRKNPALGEWLQGERGEAEPVRPPDYLTDALFSGLRLVEGVDLADLSARSGLDAEALLGERLRSLAERGLVTLDGARLRVTPAGMWVLNTVVAELL
ncbi:MAG TPA: radical SAM family heme chaperone HemW [Deinococcales bacterium]|nr:radical SAM family heme chaperone HemW [Deinococcales bacterium]